MARRQHASSRLARRLRPAAASLAALAALEGPDTLMRLRAAQRCVAKRDDRARERGCGG